VSPNLADRVRRFRSIRALVIGEAMLDSYLRGQASRLSREAPVPIVALDDRDDAPGGAANTAVNVTSLGGSAQLLSVIGDDAEGQRLAASLEAQGVAPTDLVIAAERSTLTKERILAGDQMLARVDSGSTEALDEADEAELLDRLSRAYTDADVVIVSDYDYGVMTPGVLEALEKLESDDPKPLIVDARDLTRYRALPVTAAKPNYTEAARLLGESERRGSKARAMQVGSSADRLLDLTGAEIVAVTMDADGVFVFERDAPPYRTYCRPRSDSQATGGGDTFVAALALALASGAPTTDAAELASAAATVVVAREGTATCSDRDLILTLSAETKRIVDREQLRDRVAYHRSQGRRVVFTNGCFDILHRGHTTYLNRAKALGDVLFVGVNDDASVRRLKGPGRPINTLDDRLQVLEALSCVDHVVPFSEDTPVGLLEVVRPDVFAKGGDYTMDNLPEAPLVERMGGSVQLLPLVDDRSTSRIIARVRRDRDGHRADDRRAPVSTSGRGDIAVR
jgi:D-beta-D-heptose 7-phosphate kinase/D-beta-D-heptose 1-phosphate adenosyltransferase